MAYITMRDGQKIFVRILGKGQPVILLHGYATDSRIWLPLIWPFMQKFQFILPDFRGFGQSAATPFSKDCCAFKSYSNDIDDLLTALALDRVYLCGISLGAYMSMFYMLDKGCGRVKKFLCIDHSPVFRHEGTYQFGVGGEQHERWIKMMESLAAAVKPYQASTKFHDLPRPIRQAGLAMIREFVASAFSSCLMQTGIGLVITLPFLRTIILSEDHWYPYFYVMDSYLHCDYNFLEDLSKITVPTTVIVGLKSKIFPPEGSFHIYKRLENARLIPFSRSGHVPIFAEPIKFLKEFRRFLQA